MSLVNKRTLSPSCALPVSAGPDYSVPASQQKMGPDAGLLVLIE